MAAGDAGLPATGAVKEYLRLLLLISAAAAPNTLGVAWAFESARRERRPEARTEPETEDKSRPLRDDVDLPGGVEGVAASAANFRRLGLWSAESISPGRANPDKVLAACPAADEARSFISSDGAIFLDGEVSRLEGIDCVDLCDIDTGEEIFGSVVLLI